MLFDRDNLIYCPFKRGDSKIVFNESLRPLKYHRSLQREIPQVYQILTAFGGIPNSGMLGAVAPPPPPGIRPTGQGQEQNGPRTSGFRGSEIRIWTRYVPLHIDCFYICFDGSKFVAALDVFEFKPFDGEVEVTSLEAYPMVYHTTSHPEGELSHLEQRGCRYIDLTVASHQNYNGRTLGKFKEEVGTRESQVVIIRMEN